MHITGLVLVFTASVIHWGSYIFCYTVDIYDDYGVCVRAYVRANVVCMCMGACAGCATMAHYAVWSVCEHEPASQHG